MKRRLLVVPVALVLVALTLRAHLPIERVQLRLTVRGERYDGAVPVVLHVHDTRCIVFFNCWMDVLDRRIDTRPAVVEGDHVTVDAVPLRYLDLGGARVESIELGMWPRGVSLAPMDHRAPAAPADGRVFGSGYALDWATREGDVAVMRAHVYFLHHPIYFYAPGVRSVRVELDTDPLPAARFALSSQGWVGVAHAASRSASSGESSPSLTIPAGAEVPLPFTTGVTRRGWPGSQGALSPSPADAVVGCALVDEPTWRDVLRAKTTARPAIPLTREEWDALRRRADGGGGVQVALAADGTALRLTTRPGVTALRYVVLASFRPGDALTSADALRIDVRP